MKQTIKTFTWILNFALACVITYVTYEVYCYLMPKVFPNLNSFITNPKMEVFILVIIVGIIFHDWIDLTSKS